jgi:hypothetical protein
MTTLLILLMIAVIWLIGRNWIYEFGVSDPFGGNAFVGLLLMAAWTMACGAAIALVIWGVG